AVTSLGHNLIGKTDGSSGWGGTDLTGTAAAPLNPQLGALANNGGPTQTMALASTSSAIDAGSFALLGPAAEVQTVTVTGSAGSFTLTFNGSTTTSLVFNASAAAVQNALNALSTIGGVGGSVAVNQVGNVYTVTFGG